MTGYTTQNLRISTKLGNELTVVTDHRSKRCTLQDRIPERLTLISLGSNKSCRLGTPCETLVWAAQSLRARGLKIHAISPIYETEALGGGRQPRFVNAVIAIVEAPSPFRLLRLMKSIERSAGRRPGRRWGPRELDLDLIDDRGHKILPGARHSASARLILPHPEAHRRAFVLRPLRDIAPHWRHPVLQQTAAALLRGLRPAPRLRPLTTSGAWANAA
jgi:2-amino-4-hydroxy-6-hydroxymethyldihydropteridine diphosphokinase